MSQSVKPPKILIQAWAQRHWDPPPSQITLCRWARLQRIDPPPQKVGNRYYVDPDAKLVDRNGYPVGEVHYKGVTPAAWVRQGLRKR